MSLYFYHPIRCSSYRIVLREDLLKDWVLIRIFNNRTIKKVFHSYQLAMSDLEKAVKSCQKRGFVEMVKKGSSSHHGVSDSSELSVLGTLAKSFTENNDWVDLTNCFELSADEFADTNWKRFKRWLSRESKTAYDDRDVYQFAYFVWKGYRDTAVI